MKVTLDIDALLHDEKITPSEYDRLKELAATSTGSLAFNIAIGFGVVAVSGAALALMPSSATAIAIGLTLLLLGSFFVRTGAEQWTVLLNICVLVGALMAGGGIAAGERGSLQSILLVAFLFGAAALVARSALLAVLATLALSAAIGARTGYFHASYFLVIREPVLTVTLFSLLAIGLYQLSKILPPAYERLALVSARTALFLVNFGFWIGSLWGDRFARDIVVSENLFAVLWALALAGTAVWAWKRNRRWVLNATAVFGGIHFYTQWFENLKASPGTVLVAGLLALAFALGLKYLNEAMRERIPGHAR